MQAKVDPITLSLPCPMHADHLNSATISVEVLIHDELMHSRILPHFRLVGQSGPN